MTKTLTRTPDHSHVDAQVRASADAADQRMRALAALVSRLSRRLPAAQIGDAVLREATTAAGGTAGAIWVVDARRERINLLTSLGYDDPSPFAQYALQARTPITDAVRTGEPIYVADIEDYAERYPESAPQFLARDPRRFAVACLPLVSEGRVVGGLSFPFWDQHSFGEDDRRFLELVANICAQALDRARLLEEERSVSAALIETNRTLNAVIGASPAAIMALDSDGTVRFWNRSAERMFGWSAPEVLGRFVPAVREERRSELRSRLEVVWRGESIDALETRAMTRDRGVIDVSVWAGPLPQPDGSLQCLCMVVDVTDRKRHQAREELLAQATAVLGSSLDPQPILERLAALAVPHVADWALVDLFAADGGLECVVVKHANAALADVARALPRRLTPGPDGSHAPRAAAEARSQLVRDVTDEMLVAGARDEAHLQAARAARIKSFVRAPLIVGGRSLGMVTLASSARRYDEADLRFVEELARRTAASLDNARLYADLTALVARLENIQSVTSELSRARTPREVAATTARHGARAAGALSCVVWMAEPDGSLALLDGYGVPEMQVGTWARLPAGSDMPALRVVATGEPLWVETDADYQRICPTIYAQQRETQRLRAFAALPLVIAGARAGVVVFAFSLGHHFSDDERRFLATMARQCEQALERARLFANEGAARLEAEEARARAELASRSKDEFLAMLGHELRNPLAPIATALELLKLRGDPRFSRERQVIERQVTHLTGLVDDLLDVSRITRGKIELRRQRMSLVEAVTKAVEIASPLFEQKRHHLELSIPTVAMHLEGDAMRLAQVVANLLTNAAKYTDAGGLVSLDAVREGHEIVLSVRDNGVGIAPELLPHVFDLFVQGSRASDREQGGLGLGLALVRNLVELHGGTVAARSDGAGRGSVFVVRLPALPMEAAGASPAADPSPSQAVVRSGRRRILLVDDNIDAGEVMADLLREAGHDVALAHDGAQALRMFDDFPAEVAILDIGLPVMDGYELAARLRERRPLRVAALTGYGQANDLARSREAGFQAHFVKPVSWDDLLRYVEGVV